MAPLEVTVVCGAPGSGKSYQAWQAACEEPGLYVFAYPTIKLLREQTERAAPGHPRLFEAHSDSNGRKRVQRQIEKHLETIRQEGLSHAFLLITHAGLVQNDFSDLRHWHWRIDEAPMLHSNGKLTISKGDLPAWTALIELDDPADGWSAARWKGARDNVGQKDASLLRGKDAMVAAAEQGRLNLNTEKLAPGTFHWISMWDVRSLPEPQSIEINSASFMRSISAKLMRHLMPEVVFVERGVTRPREAQPLVTIRWFADWEASSKHWATREGRRDLKLIASCVRDQSPDLGFWSGNCEAMKLLDHYISASEAIQPKAMGLNQYDSAQSCALIYSAKAMPGDDLLVQHFGVGREDIRVAREDEDIFQFAYRGSIRRPASGDPYTIYLFSRQQAERLKQALETSGLTNVQTNRATVAGVSAEPVAAKKKGRPKRWVGETDQERKARLAAYARRRRAAKK